MDEVESSINDVEELLLLMCVGLMTGFSVDSKISEDCVILVGSATPVNPPIDVDSDVSSNSAASVDSGNSVGFDTSVIPGTPVISGHTVASGKSVDAVSGLSASVAVSLGCVDLVLEPDGLRSKTVVGSATVCI